MSGNVFYKKVSWCLICFKLSCFEYFFGLKSFATVGCNVIFIDNKTGYIKSMLLFMCICVCVCVFVCVMCMCVVGIMFLCVFITSIKPNGTVLSYNINNLLKVFMVELSVTKRWEDVHTAMHRLQSSCYTKKCNTIQIFRLLHRVLT